VGDESSESLKERMKDWVELLGSSCLLYHKKQSLLDHQVMMSLSSSHSQYMRRARIFLSDVYL